MHNTIRSSHRRCSVRKDVLRNLEKSTGKHLCQSLFFNNVAGLRPATLLKKRLTQVFSCEFCEISENTFFKNTFGWLLLYHFIYNKHKNCILISSVGEFIKTVAWLLLTFFICLHNQLSSVNSIAPY